MEEKKVVDEMIHEIDILQKEHSEDLKKGIGHAVENILLHGMAPKDALGIDHETILAMSQEAYSLYNSGKYNEALHLFGTLSMMQCSYPYLFAIAACNHMMKEYKMAAEAYGKCSLISPDDPTPYYHAADCYLQLGEVVSAMVALQMVQNRAAKQPEYQQMSDRAKLMLEKISHGESKS